MFNMNSYGSSVSSKQEELPKLVASELLNVTDALQKLTAIKRDLESNAQKIKSEIQSKFSTLLSQIRSREEQLLHQVDVLTENQTKILYNQIDDLFNVTFECIERGSIDPEKSPFIRELEGAKRMHMQSIPIISLKLDTNKLLNAIQECGSIEVKGTLLRFPPTEVPKCLPNEEYDAEMDACNLMHKTLQDSRSVVEIRPPSKRLNQNKEISDSDQNSDRINQWLQKQTPSVFDKNTKHLHKWLNQIRDADEQEPDNFEGLQFIDKQSNSESIEKISLSQCSSPFEHISPFTLPQLPLSQWLHQNNVEGDCKHTDSIFPKENEIKYLTSKDGAKIDISKIDIEEVCIANELCSSFEDCLCDSNCALQWLQQNNTDKAKETKKTSVANSGNNSFINPMLNIMYGNKEDYLTSKGKDKNGVEKKEKTKFFFPKNDQKWISECTWLTSNTRNNQIVKEIHTMFDPYLKPTDLGVWLSKS